MTFGEAIADAIVINALRQVLLTDEERERWKNVNVEDLVERERTR